MMLDGLRSRCTTSELCSWASASHNGCTQRAYRCLWQRTARGDGLAQRRSEHVLRGEPRGGGHGVRVEDLGAVPSPITRAASISSRKRVRDSGSAAIRACMVLSAAVRPDAVRAR